MKKLIAVLTLGLLFTGCGGSGDNTETQPQAQPQTEVTTAGTEGTSAAPEEVQAEVGEPETGVAPAESAAAAGAYTEMDAKIKELSENELMLQDENYLNNYYGFEAADMKDFYFAQSADPMKADTVLVVNAVSPEKAEEMSGTIETVKQNMADTYKDYAPEQFDVINNAIIKTNGNYVYYIVSPKASEIAETVEAALK